MFCQCVRLVANDDCSTCMRVCMCPVRQFNVQLYVEKVFIAQKTSEDRGGKVRKRVKDTELLVGLLEKELGEGGVESRKKGQTVKSTRWRRHIARQGNNRATGKIKNEARNGTTNNGNGSTERSDSQRFPSRMRRESRARPLFRARENGACGTLPRARRLQMVLINPKCLW